MLTDEGTVIDPTLPWEVGVSRSPYRALGGEELTWSRRERVRCWQRGHGDKVTKMRSCVPHVENDKQFGIAGA